LDAVQAGLPEEELEFVPGYRHLLVHWGGLRQERQDSVCVLHCQVGVELLFLQRDRVTGSRQRVTYSRQRVTYSERQGGRQRERERQRETETERERERERAVKIKHQGKFKEVNRGVWNMF
jgi:hypothetical protein